MRRLHRAAIALVAWLSAAAYAQEAGNQPSQVTTTPPSGIARWFDPSTAPFIPVPEIDVDPNSGTTLGLIAVIIGTDDHGTIDRIIAPDIIHNPYFGWGSRFRWFDYPSEDTQWSVVGGAKQRVESEFDGLFQTGRLRQRPWSFTTEAVYDRSGTPRFYGLGNTSKIYNQTVYTDQQKYVTATIGWNITHAWQLAYTLTAKEVKVDAGNLGNIPSITRRFAGLLGIGITHEILNRASLTYDTRDDLTVPTRGMAVVVYGGPAGRAGMFNDSLFSEVGADGRFFWTPVQDLTVATHFSTRYMPTSHHAPFWALSNLGGDESIIGGPQPLRGFGTSRFYDHDAFVLNLELRKRVYTLDAGGTRIDLQVTPFFDAGRVFSHSSTFPISQMHTVGGVGFRAIARPNVVGYVDIGKGSEGVVVFTGINYPF